MGPEFHPDWLHHQPKGGQLHRLHVVKFCHHPIKTDKQSFTGFICNIHLHTVYGDTNCISVVARQTCERWDSVLKFLGTVWPINIAPSLLQLTFSHSSNTEEINSPAREAVRTKSFSATLRDSTLAYPLSSGAAGVSPVSCRKKLSPAAVPCQIICVCREWHSKTDDLQDK